MNTLYLATVAVSLYVNDNDAMIPEVWANMGLAILEENMVAAALVHRDFSPEVANFGDVVNTRRPGQFKIRRKGDNDPVLGQDANTVNVRVPLDQHFYTNFTIKDGEASKSFQDLVDLHLLPAMQNVARAVDRSILGRVHGYTANGVGGLDQLSGANARDTILDARQKLNENKAFVQDRHMVVSPTSETALLKTDLFLAANQRGDGGTALEEASLGRLLGFNFWLDQNVNSTRVVDSDVDQTNTVTGAEVIGTSLLALTGTFTVVDGTYATVAGDDRPLEVTASVANTSITVSPALTSATAIAAIVTLYTPVQFVANEVAGENKAMSVDGFATGKPPQVGQLFATGTGATRRVYTIIESEVVSATVQSILLDRPLELAVTLGDDAFPGPAGSYNFGFHREAIALVNRPLALPAADMGVRSQVGVHNDISMRISMQYDIAQQGTVVTADMLAGVAILDTDLGVVMYG
jgi:hypothetical protein